MKVALLTDGIWPFVMGGMQKHSYYLCKYLAKSQVEVDLFHTFKGGHVEDTERVFSEDELKFIKVYCIPYPDSIYFPGHYLYKSYQYSKRIYEELTANGNSYDLIYIQGFSGWYLLTQSKPLKIDHNARTLLNFHGLEMFQKSASFKSAFQQAIFRPFVKMQLAKANYVQSLGGRLTKILISLGIEKAKIVEHGISIEDSWVKREIIKSTRPRKFGFIGRNERRKGIHELNRVLSRLLRSGLSFEMNFVGPLAEDQKIKSQSVRYFGKMTNERDIQALLDEVDFLVLPSFSEGMPTVILEGMSRGCAIIASDVGAVSQLVDSQNGYLIEPGDVNMLDNALRNAIQISDNVLDGMKHASLQRVKSEFRWEKLSAEMLSSFHTIIKV